MQPLPRLTSQIDALLPHLVALAALRWVVCVVLGPVGRVALRRAAPAVYRRVRRSLRRASSFVAVPLRGLLATLVVYVGVCLLQYSSTTEHCGLHSDPRVMGVSAGVALTCLVFTTRMSVSLSSAAALLCVRELNPLAGVAAAATAAQWVDIGYVSVMLVTCANAALLHCVSCGMLSSLGLAALCAARTFVVVCESTASLALTYVDGGGEKND